jgi:CheY-like chemotaxis protein
VDQSSLVSLLRNEHDRHDFGSEAVMTAIFSPPELDDVEYLAGPSILIFSDDPERQAAIGRAISSAGGRISAALGIGSAAARISEHAAPDGVIVDLLLTDEATAEDLLDIIEQGACADRFRSIAMIQPGMIDLAAARAGHGDVQLLCAPDDGGLEAAVNRLLAPRIIALMDVSAEGAARLRELSEEAGRIAHALAALSEYPLDQGRGDTAVDAPTIRAMIRARRARAQFFPAELFADPAWDMLLDLFAARLEGRSVAVSSLCIAAAVPSTTGLRWIKTLTDLSLFVRVADPNDRRRVFIELAPAVAETMQRCLAAMGQLTKTGL